MQYKHRTCKEYNVNNKMKHHVSEKERDCFMNEIENVDPLFVASLDKGMKILEAFYGRSRYLRFSDFIEITGFSKGAVQRYIRTWEILGFLRKDSSTKQYSLTPKSLDLTYSFLHSHPLIELAIPHLVDLKNRCNESVSLSLRDNLELIYVFRSPSLRDTLKGSIIGRRLPLYCTSGGRAMLSLLQDDELRETLAIMIYEQKTKYTNISPEEIFDIIVKAREEGFSIVDEEVLLGEITVAAPIKNPLSNREAAVHIPVMKKDWSVEDVRRELAPEAVRLARTLSF